MSFELRKLEDVCDILDHMRIPITSRDRKEGPYPYYGANGIQDYIDDYIFDDELVLLAEDGGNFGSKEKPIAYRISGKTWVNNHAHVLKPKNIIDVDYLCYSLMYYDVSGLVNGATRQKLTQSEMRKINIRYRSLEKQRQMVFEIKLISNIISSREHQLSNLNLLVKSRFIEMFGDPVLNNKGWPVKKLKQLTSKISSGNTPKGGREVYVSEGITFFRSQNVWRNYFDMSDIAYIDEATHKKMADTSLKHGDLLITKTGRFNTENSSLGRTALFLGENDSANINGHVYLVRLKAGISHQFVLHILISNQFRDLIRKVCVGGIDKRQLNKNHIEDFPIIIPPLEQQEKYADFVKQVDKSKLAIQQSLYELETLKKSLMQQYFG